VAGVAVAGVFVNDDEALQALTATVIPAKAGILYAAASQ
jgi:hypothetical protein